RDAEARFADAAISEWIADMTDDLVTPDAEALIGLKPEVGAVLADELAQGARRLALAEQLADRLRALAQSMARELGPQGLHVAHVVIDGLIDTAFAREHFAQQVADAGPDGILDPDHIADAYWWLHQQPRDAWTFELDLRPSVERW
ncbi:MAG: virulence factor SrfC family protein, partial [Rubrivivax sp.]|nr:virulence factor SrfC family protein [Rubrivivax sp.]